MTSAAKTGGDRRGLPHGSSVAHVLVTLALACTACGPSADPASTDSLSAEWIEFEGTWNAAGSRRNLQLGADRRTSILDLSGTLLLHGPGRPGTGFRSEVIALGDSTTGLVGRGVWTDERGDQVYSELVGEGTASKNRITGKIVGGTGRYAAATGSYDFSWHYVLEAEDGSIQGRVTGLKGLVRRDPLAGASGR